MTEVLQPDCQLSLACEGLDHCGLDALEESPEIRRPPNTGARLWGRVRSKLLRQKVPGPLPLYLGMGERNTGMPRALFAVPCNCLMGREAGS